MSLPPLRLGSDQDWGPRWTCQCGTHLRGYLDQNFDLEQLKKLRAAPVQFDRSRLDQPPECVEEYVRETILGPGTLGKLIEKRMSYRHDVVMHVPTLEFDATMRPLGPPIMMTSRDVSTSGIGLISTRAVSGRFLAVELAGPQGNLIQVLVLVLRCRPRGPYQDVAGEFVTRMDDKGPEDDE